jgi:hypothetical protein
MSQRESANRIEERMHQMITRSIAAHLVRANGGSLEALEPLFPRARSAARGIEVPLHFTNFDMSIDFGANPIVFVNSGRELSWQHLMRDDGESPPQRALSLQECDFVTSDISEALTQDGESPMQCSICFEDVSARLHAGARCVRLMCSHAFCWDCITRWLTRSPTCPMCKADFRRLLEEGEMHDEAEASDARGSSAPPARIRRLRRPPPGPPSTRSS